MKRKKSPGKPSPIYHLYGLRVRSPWPMPYERCKEASRPDVELVEGSVAFFDRAVQEAVGRPWNGNEWFQHVALADASDYVRWAGLFEFSVSADGRRIVGRALRDVPFEAFSAYLLGTVLSFSLLKLGRDPLHATAVVVDGGAVGFLGNNGYGKSTLGGAFLQAGFPLLTDDVLVATRRKQGFCAHSGPPRIKLFPEIARALLGKRATGIPMNPLTKKRIIPLDRHHFHRAIVPLRTLYVLPEPEESPAGPEIAIRRLAPQEAFPALVSSVFNDCVLERDRLRKHFHLMTQIASAVPVKKLSYPRRLRLLSSVRDAILKDLSS